MGELMGELMGNPGQPRFVADNRSATKRIALNHAAPRALAGPATQTQSGVAVKSMIKHDAPRLLCAANKSGLR